MGRQSSYEIRLVSEIGLIKRLIIVVDKHLEGCGG